MSRGAVPLPVITPYGHASAGAWYYVWLKPRWRAVPFGESEYGDKGHPELWAGHVAPAVAAHYRIARRSAAYKRLRDAYAGMPRGRVALLRNTWVIYHGNDFPQYPAVLKKLLWAKFGLFFHPGFGRTRLEFDEHETMIEDDRVILQEILGRVPYGPGRKGMF